MKMQVHIGRINIEPFPPKAEEVQPEADPAPYLRALEALHHLLAPGTWSLAGGLVVPIAVGRFYRKHSDIDIVMPWERLNDVVAAFRSHGYELYTNLSVIHRSRGILFEVKVRSESTLVRFRPRHLYVKTRNSKPSQPLLDRIDLYPYFDRGKYLETCNSKRVLLRRAMQHNSLQPFDRPGVLRCLHVDNVATLKSTCSGAKHKLDCAVLQGGAEVAQEWFRNIADLVAGTSARSRAATGNWTQ